MSNLRTKIFLVYSLLFGSLAFAHDQIDLKLCVSKTATLGREILLFPVDALIAKTLAQEFAKYPDYSEIKKLNLRIEDNIVIAPSVSAVNRIYGLKVELGSFHFEEFSLPGDIPKKIYDDALASNFVLISKYDYNGVLSASYHDIKAHAASYYRLSKMKIWSEIVHTMADATAMMKDRYVHKKFRRLAKDYRSQFSEILESQTLLISIHERELSEKDLNWALAETEATLEESLEKFNLGLVAIRRAAHL